MSDRGTAARAWGALRDRRLLEWAAIGLIAVSLMRLAVMLPQRAKDLDYSHYYLATRLLLEGKSVYTTSLVPLYAQYGFVPDQDMPMVGHSPTLLWMFTPVAVLRPELGFWIWVGIEAVALAAILWLVWRLLGSRLSPRGWLIVVAAVLSSDAVYWHFYTSQVQLLVAAVILAAYSFHRSGKYLAACLVLTCAGMLKLFPFVLLPWFIWRGRGTLLTRLGRVAVVLASALSVVLLTGWSRWRDFFELAIPRISHWGLNMFPNQGLPSLIGKLGYRCGLFSRSSPVGWWVSVGIGLSLIALIYGICFWKSRGAEEEVEFCLLSIAMLAGGGLNEPHYFVLMIFPLVALSARVVSNRSAGRIVALLLILLLLNHLGPWDSFNFARHPYLTILMNHSGLYGLVIAGWFWGKEWRRPRKVPVHREEALLGGRM